MTSGEGVHPGTDEGALEAARAAERRRIARDLHDTVIQDLVAVGMALAADPPGEADLERRARDAVMAEQLERAIARLRYVVGNLTAEHARVPLSSSVATLVSEAALALGFAPGLRVAGAIDDLDDDLADHVVAVVQESLSNVVRHAAASGASVTVEVTDDRVLVEVVDDGRGLPTTVSREHGLGNLESRAVDCGGRMTLARGRFGRGLRMRWEALRATDHH